VNIELGFIFDRSDDEILCKGEFAPGRGWQFAMSAVFLRPLRVFPNMVRGARDPIANNSGMHSRRVHGMYCAHPRQDSRQGGPR